MYSPKVITAKAKAIESNHKVALKQYSVAEVDEWLTRLNSLVHQDASPGRPQLVRKLTAEEQRFVDNEILMCKISYKYWAERYAWIKTDKGGIARLKLWESQEMLIDT